MSLPACRRRLECTFRSASSRVHVAATSCLGSRLDARWQEVWPRLENKSASSPHLFSRSDDSAFYFLHFRAVAAAVAMARAASCGTQRARPVPVKPTCVTCQSDGTDLSPANLSRCSSSCAISHYAAIVHAASAYSESCHPASRTPTQRHCSKLERRTLWRRNCGTW